MNSNTLIAIRKEIVLSFDLSTVTTSKDWAINDIGDYTIVGIQADWSDLTGTLNSVIKAQIRAAIDMNWVDVTGLTNTMNAAASSAYFEILTFSGDGININFTKNDVTGGTLNIKIILKRK